jgi:hypothetical protein
MWTLNPFKKHDVSEFPGVLVPLDEAPHRGSITNTRHKSSPTRLPGEKGEGDEKSAHKDEDARSGSPSIAAGNTIGLTLEQLRAEIEEDVAAGDTQSAYDRKLRTV